MQSPAFRMLAPAAESPPPYESRVGVDVASISSSPERARALPLSIRGVAAGLRLWSVVDVHVLEDCVLGLDGCILICTRAGVRVNDCVRVAWSAVVVMIVMSFMVSTDWDISSVLEVLYLQSEFVFVFDV